MEDTNTAVAVTTLCLAVLGAALALAHRLHVACSRRSAPSTPAVPPGATESPVQAVGAPRAAYKNHSLLIVRCNDPLMWYANMVGKEVPYFGTWAEDGLHKSAEPAGFTNVVRPTDAIILERRSK